MPSAAIGGLLVELNFRPEVDSDVLSGVTVDCVGMDVRVKFGDSTSNGFRDMRRAVFVSNERTRPRLITSGRNAFEAFRLKMLAFSGNSQKILRRY